MASFVLPAFVNGQPTWLEEADPEIVRLLQHGDPTIGWEGDPRLYMRRNLHSGGWTVWRLGEDGSEHAICSSKGNHKLDKSLLVRLRDHDSRRVDIHARVEKQNAAAQRALDTKEYEDTHEKLERVYHALGRDVGHLY